MEDWLLIRIGLCISILGIIALFFITQGMELSESSINRINNIEESSAAVRITGRVTDVKTAGRATILEVTKQEAVPVIVFDSLEIDEGETVAVRGKIEEYEGTKEILAEEISVIS